jgi:hypothetical protein
MASLRGRWYSVILTPRAGRSHRKTKAGTGNREPGTINGSDEKKNGGSLQASLLLPLPVAPVVRAVAFAGSRLPVPGSRLSVF